MLGYAQACTLVCAGLHACMRVHVEARGQPEVLFLTSSVLVFFRQGLFLALHWLMKLKRAGK